MGEKYRDIENDKRIQNYSEQLVTKLNQYGVTKYDHSQFNVLDIVGKSRSAIVYSAIFQGKKYALKCLNNNLCLTAQTFKKFVREDIISSTKSSWCNTGSRFRFSSETNSTCQKSLKLDRFLCNQILGLLHSSQRKIEIEVGVTVAALVKEIIFCGSDNDYLIIDKIIEEYKINFYNYNEFSNSKKIGEGGYGWVEKAEWKACSSTVALKSLKIKQNSNENLVKKFAREALQSVDASALLSNHPQVKPLNNQLDFQSLSKLNTCAISKQLDTEQQHVYFQPSSRERNPQTNKIVIVLQLANNGNLQDYLKGKRQNGIFKISWANISRIAKEITFGLHHLHINEIVHRGLDDIGPYIAKGIREKIIPNTPQSYANLYVNCWSSDPDQRPPLYKILNDLIKMSKMPVESKFIINYISESEKTKSNQIQQINEGLHLTSDTIDSPYCITKSVTNNNLLNNLLKVFYDSTNRGNTFTQISKMIIDIIENNNRTPKNYFIYIIGLDKNQNLNSDLQCLLGFIYLMGIGTDEDSNAAFKLF
ncbi:26737_t:CDS:10 [Dentiscutata erythropus]|uniref:26737_t:CDS:1 n=1 Tax=Dentiscutata erythropus TaxID=1348616 RepID=A0A9N9H1G7_9GLOM|nr:26737_t:CDS:10 [Dentiscutata erythropus]